jgi:eukaryotic-like serine/threonine-protein kinase
VPVDTNILPPRYRGAQRIGRGGMGDIYRATDEALGRAVAVKVLGEHYAQDESVRERFAREALAAARLSGRPHVITIFDVGEWEDRPYIVMEYLGGGSLDDAIRKRGAVEPGQAVEWLEQAGAALDAAHSEGVVHRDVKPANLLLDRDGNVHVADFGVASAAGLDSMTKTGTVVGTAGYLSPEQAQGEPATPASDLYGLAVLAFELLTGERPFSGDTAAAEASAHVHAPIPSISGVRRELPHELDQVFERALAKDPRARYPSAAEFVADVRHALHDAAGATAVVPPATPPAPPTVPRERPGPPPRPPAAGARPPWVVPALVLLGLLAVGIAGAILLAGRGDGDQGGGATTIERTVTEQGTTREVTVTAEQAPQEEAPPATTAPPAGNLSLAQAKALQDESTAAMRRGDWETALSLAQRALARLQGTGDVYEGYANYNVGRSLIELGNCEQGLQYIDRSEQIQGSRPEFDQARAQCE